MTKALSYQLYSSRNFPPLSNTLKMLADIGYSSVEGYGGLFNDPDADALPGMLAENGLTMPTTHIGLNDLEADPARMVAFAKALDWKVALVPAVGPDERVKPAEGWAELGRRLEAAGAPLREAGVGFGWHNHAFEFAPLPDGSMPYVHLVEAAPSLKLELDLAWIARAGQDPVEWINRYKDRLIGVHVKDLAPEGENADEDGWADVGHGTMDWDAINAALAGTPAEYFVLEHDNPKDHERFAKRSFATASQF